MLDTYLGYNSEFGALVFDPSREPKTPEPRLPTPKPTPQAPPQRAPADTKPPPLKYGLMTFVFSSILMLDITFVLV